MATDDLKICPKCGETGGDWRTDCDCGWQFGSDAGSSELEAKPRRVPQVDQNSLNESRRARRDDDRHLFKMAMNEYRKTEMWSPLPDDDERMIFIRELKHRYRNRRVLAAASWASIFAIAFYALGSRALTPCGFQLVCWLAYTVRRAKNLERRLVNCCSDLRVHGDGFLASQIESLYPLLRFSPKIADDVLGRFGGQDTPPNGV